MLPSRVTGIAAGRATFTGGSRGPRVLADTLAAHTVPAAAAERAVLGDAGLRAARAVAVLARPAAPALALAARAVAVAWGTKRLGCSGPKPFPVFRGHLSSLPSDATEKMEAKKMRKKGAGAGREGVECRYVFWDAFCWVCLLIWSLN